MKNCTIEIGCPPGGPRPGHLLPAVLEGTGLEVDDFKETGRFFGDWGWVLLDEAKVAKFEAALNVIAERIGNLYRAGVIRYGSYNAEEGA